MAAVITFHNSKGGVGKSVSVYNIAQILAGHRKVLVIDMDPGCTLTAASGINPSEARQYGIQHALYGQVPAEKLIVPAKPPHKYAIIPANPNLSQAETPPFSDYPQQDLDAIEHALDRAIQPLRDRYDYILIDTHPTLTLLGIMPLIASDYLLIPCSTHYASIRGFAITFRQLRHLILGKKPQLKLLGVLPTMHDPRTRQNRRGLATLEHLCRTFGIPLLPEPIPYSVHFADAVEAAQAIIDYSKDRRIVLPYAKVAAWIDQVVFPKEDTQYAGNRA